MPGHTAGSLHSASRGLSHGIQTGIAFRERHGEGMSIHFPVPGIVIEAVPKLIHGRMWNSVFKMVGQTGTSNGTETPPTDSGGMGRSGVCLVESGMPAA